MRTVVLFGSWELFVALVTGRLPHSLSKAHNVTRAASSPPPTVPFTAAVTLSPTAGCRRRYQVVLYNRSVLQRLGCKQLRQKN
jgi:hypothetical protein